MKNDHKTKKLVIKEADVDEKIIPVVNWLNSFAGIYTRHSCQGNYGKDGNEKIADGAYVTFYCDDIIDLIRICDHFTYLASITVDVYQGSLRYHIKFHTSASLQSAIHAIKKGLWK